MAARSDFGIGSAGGALVLAALATGSRFSKVARIGAATVGALGLAYATRSAFAAKAYETLGRQPTDMSFLTRQAQNLGERERAPKNFDGNIIHGTVEGSDRQFFSIRINGKVYVATQTQREGAGWTMEKWKPSGIAGAGGALLSAVSGSNETPPFVGELIKDDGTTTERFHALVQLMHGTLDSYQLGEAPQE